MKDSLLAASYEAVKSCVRRLSATASVKVVDLFFPFIHLYICFMFLFFLTVNLTSIPSEEEIF